MSFLSVFIKWCLRFVGVVGSMPKYLNGSRKKYSPRESDLNIVLTDVRTEGANQKCRSFLTIAEEFLKHGRVVNVVVVAAAFDGERVRKIYQEIFSDLLADRNFNIIIVGFNSAAIRGACIGILTVLMLLSVKLKGRAWNANLAVLSASLFLRYSQFGRIYDDLKTKSWLGLTGGVELQSFMIRRGQRRSESKICAIQFGQASEDQHHFAGYKVDRLFVYDQYAADLFAARIDQSVSISIAGSPEFEYEAKKLMRIEPEPFSGRLKILFIDQPVHQRSEFTPDFIAQVESQLLVLSGGEAVDLYIKAHPRGSAFGAFPAEAYCDEEFSKLLSKAHVVVSFFSNLADLSLLTGRTTIYLGAGRIFSARKLDWIREMGGHLVEEPEDLPATIEQAFGQIRERTERPELSRPEFRIPLLASQIIFKEITNSDVA